MSLSERETSRRRLRLDVLAPLPLAVMTHALTRGRPPHSLAPTSPRPPASACQYRTRTPRHARLVIRVVSCTRGKIIRCWPSDQGRHRRRAMRDRATSAQPARGREGSQGITRLSFYAVTLQGMALQLPGIALPSLLILQGRSLTSRRPLLSVSILSKVRASGRGGWSELVLYEFRYLVP